ncbi:MAG: phage terminase large subunit [Pseudomonadota bacterium]|nr:phage terminase large subunit [Pseudomonadota bacterium]
MAAKVLTHTYTPRGACKELFSERGAEVLVSGPAGTGKSRACLEKLHAVALANPGMRGLIVRKTATSLTSSALVTWKQFVVAEALEGGVVKFYGGSAEEPAQYRYENGSTVVLGGMDKSSRIMSTEYDLVYVQEATELSLEEWEALSTRLRNGVVSFQQIVADCNPSYESHWLKVRCDVGATRLLWSKHTDNPRLYGDDLVSLTGYGVEYMGRLDALSGVLRLRLRDGVWSSAAGVIYDGWDPAVHVVEWFDIPVGWERWWAVDFGFTNPFVLQCWAEDPDGRLFLYREIYRTQRTVDRHAAEILKYVTDGEGVWLEPKPRVVVCDHDPEGQVVFRRVTGLACVDADKEVGAGIQAVVRRLRVAGDGRPRLFVLEGARVDVDEGLVVAHKPTSTVGEFGGYVWDENRPESPVKVNDHGLDALRYLVMRLEGRSPARFRWVE